MIVLCASSAPRVCTLARQIAFSYKTESFCVLISFPRFRLYSFSRVVFLAHRLNYTQRENRSRIQHLLRVPHSVVHPINKFSQKIDTKCFLFAFCNSEIAFATPEMRQERTQELKMNDFCAWLV